MPDFTIQAQADLLRKLLTVPEAVVGIHGPYATREPTYAGMKIPTDAAFHILDVTVETPLTDDEKTLVEMILSGAD